MNHNKFVATFFIIAGIMILADVYFYFGIKSKLSRKWRITYLIVSALTISFMIFSTVAYLNGYKLPPFLRIYVFGITFCINISKILGCIWLLIDDLRRLFKFAKAKITSDKVALEGGIPRKKFLQLGALGTFGVLFSTFIYGIVRGGYNYSIHTVSLKLKNLPKNFEGLKIVQISDMHVGSFLSSDPLEDAFKMIAELNPDVVFFTGDLVNDITEEALPHQEVLKKLKAKHGVYSILGNHDYGDYVYNDSMPDYLEKKAHNKTLMQQVHREAGWDLLLNEHRELVIGDQKISIIGIENWGSGRFAKYGDMKKAMASVDPDTVKLLLSHDPSHWDAQVRPFHPEVDVSFAGHTHGMQFGIETKFFRFSPVQWRYDQWAGLYEKGHQQIYVNRGLGFVGYPGRVGISPEITLITLERA
ncbi:MAG: metallophosphoesterase [Bacteroidetes bacterium]|nr:metallophosphoesterase [Bacteroidota bacterium]